MKKRVVVRVGALIVLMTSDFYGAQDAQFALTSSEKCSTQDEEFRIHAYLAPLKQASEAIQKQLLDLDILLKREAWQEKLTEEVLGIYQGLERALDIFPLIYRNGLRETENAYWGHVKLSAIVAEYVDLYKKTPLTHTNRVVEILKEAHQLFGDVRAFLKYPHEALVPLNFDKLSFYQDVSLPGFAGLEAYLRTTAKKLLTHVQKAGLVPQKSKQVMFTFPVVANWSEEKRGRNISDGTVKMREAFGRFGKQNKRLFELAWHIETIVKKARLVKEDLEILSELYKNFYSVLAVEHAEIKREVDAIHVSFLDDAGLYAARNQFFQDYERFHGDFSKQLEQFYKQGVAELDLLQNVFDSSSECVRAHLVRQEGLGLTAILRRIGISSNALDSEKSVENLVQLLFWTASSQVVQDAVRRRAFETLEHIQSIVPLDSIRWVIETIQAVWLWEQKLHEPEFKDVALKNLIQLKTDTQTVQTPFIRFKDQLCVAIDQLIEGVTT